VIDETAMQLAVDWKGERLNGWLYSEKLNGCRVHWDGANFWTRGGNAVKAPKWFTKGLPRDIVLDGEIWAGREGRWGVASFQAASNAVRFGGHWFDECEIKFTAFDAPQVAGGWAGRMKEVGRAVRQATCADAIDFGTVPHTGGNFLDGVQFGLWLAGFGKRNAEGVMFRHPETSYEQGRSKSLLRCKFAGN
jgi:DNA ligase-1